MAIEPKDSGRAISIHALREEGDAIEGDKTYENIKFLSTPSARRATLRSGSDVQAVQISIHALREEGDSVCVRLFQHRANFYPRPPRGGRRTDPIFIDDALVFLSTPSARRATPALPLTLRRWYYFYPRPPRGGRPLQPYRSQHPLPISIHALREEGDVNSRLMSMNFMLFLSTPSARRATLERRDAAYQTR